MLGLNFQDDAPNFDAGLSAFIDGLGNAAAGSGQSGEAGTRRGEMAIRHPRFEHHPSRLSGGQGFRDSRKARHIGADSDRAVTSALNRMQSRIASLACAFGFEIADANTVPTGD